MADGRAGGGLGNAFGVEVVVLLRLYVRADIFRRHQPNRMTVRRQLAAQVMGATAGFHRHHARRPSAGEFHDRLALHPPAQHDMPRCIESSHAADILAEVDAQNRDRHQPAPLPSGVRRDPNAAAL
jgi:hypothetical protein